MKKDRQAAIIKLLEERVISTPKELAGELSCTDMTIRRDIRELMERGLVVKKHGCVYLQKNTAPSVFQEQIHENLFEKKAIARAALNYIDPYSVICVDSGTTAYALARQFPEKMPLSVITPSLMVALENLNRPQIQTFVIGGALYQNSKSTLCESIEALQQHAADIAFISTRAFKIPGGAFENSYPLVETKRAMVSIAKKTVLLVDHSKFDSASLCNSVSLSDIDIVITDDKTPKDMISRLVALDKTVVVTNAETNKTNVFGEGGR